MPRVEAMIRWRRALTGFAAVSWGTPSVAALAPTPARQALVRHAEQQLVHRRLIPLGRCEGRRHRVAEVRRFHWPRGASGSRWGGRGVQLGALGEQASGP